MPIEANPGAAEDISVFISECVEIRLRTGSEVPIRAPDHVRFEGKFLNGLSQGSVTKDYGQAAQ